MADIKEELLHRILVLDGAMGTMIQEYNLSEEDFRGNRLAEHPTKLAGCNDILSITNPDIISEIHHKYLQAGADIIETNSFNSNAVSLSEYGISNMVYEISLNAAMIARNAADRWMEKYPDSIKFVAGSVGPTNKSLSLSPSVDNPAERGIDRDELSAAYIEQIKGLIEGGSDVLLIETVFDTLNAKCALWSAKKAMTIVGKEIPIMVSLTLTESGRTLSGQTLEAVIASIEHFNPMSIGLNCGFGAEKMTPYIAQLDKISDYPISVYPNAGFPNEMGEYDERPETMIAHISPILKNGMINIIGGCCGTTPKHINAIANAVKEVTPRSIPFSSLKELRLSGLEHLDISPEQNFINIGERCNVAGSRKFLRLINEKKYNEALSIARKQVENGAQILDLNMDDAMLDAPIEMNHFIRLISSDPDIARVPFMIDSSNWEVIKSTLPLLQGKGIVNSISLKEGEDIFMSHASFIKEMGAAMVVMAFDEDGQATTFERKTAICRRAYDILTKQVGVNPSDIIFDPNVLSVATGIDEHNSYGIDFIRTVKWIKENLPQAKVSGGISNLSFSFRGNNFVREAMHSVFLYYAIKEGMDMAIVNVASIVPFEDIPNELREAIENVILHPSQDSTQELIELAFEYKENSDSISEKKVEDDSSMTIAERLSYAIVKGNNSQLEKLLEINMKECGSALAVIDGALMSGMNRVGELFGAGKLFLPQVVKSARTMKEAVEWLNPYIERERGNDVKARHKIVIATVKGDVHDIGKNIVAVIMRCNGFEVIDLGTMVSQETILKRAIEEKADLIGLSGLITPSLTEMSNMATLLEANNIKIPLFVGGATTSALHTAVKIAPLYSSPVVHTRDAASMPAVAKEAITNPIEFDKLNRNEQEKLRNTLKAKPNIISFAEAKGRKLNLDWDSYNPITPTTDIVNNNIIKVSEASKYINWRPFFTAWKLDASFAELANVQECYLCRANWLVSKADNDIKKATEAMQLFKDAKRAIEYIEKVANDSILSQCRFLKAHSHGENIVLETGEVIPTLRQQKESEFTIALSDYISPKNDYIATFADTIGEQIENIIRHKQERGDDYGAILYQTIADRLVEAATELFHKQIRTEIWGYSNEDKEENNPQNLLRKYYPGIRPAIGYPSLPDQSIIFTIDKIMPLSQIGISLTENGAMSPAASVCGIMIANENADYFSIGDIDDNQRKDYADRKEITVEELSKWLRL